MHLYYVQRCEFFADMCSDIAWSFFYALFTILQQQQQQKLRKENTF